jgi:uroporphyrinogen decarboxylase
LCTTSDLFTHTPPPLPRNLSGVFLLYKRSISAIAYARLREKLGLPPKPLYVYDIIQEIAIVDEDMLSLFGVDTVELGRAFAMEDKDWVDWSLPNGLPCKIPAWNRPQREAGRWVLRSQGGRILAQMPDGVLYFEQTYWPFAQADRPPESEDPAEVMGESMWTAITSPPGPLVEGPDGEQKLAEGARKLRQSTDRAIVASFGGNMLELGQFLYRNGSHPDGSWNSSGFRVCVLPG